MLIHSFMHHFILSFEIMYLIPCIKTCYGPGIMGKKDVSANTHQNSRVIRDGSRCQITNAFTDFSNQMTMFLVWPLDGGSAPFTLSSLPLQLRTCHPLLSLGPSTWLLHVPPPPPRLLGWQQAQGHWMCVRSLRLSRSSHLPREEHAQGAAGPRKRSASRSSDPGPRRRHQAEGGQSADAGRGRDTCPPKSQNHKQYA